MALHWLMSTQTDNLETAADRYTRAVTVTVARRVAPGRERDFERWVDGLLHVAETFPGFLGGGILRPPASGQDWHVVYRFASKDALSEWEASPVRAEWLRRADDVMSETGVTRTSGLETWFSLPGRTAPAPPRWKWRWSPLPLFSHSRCSSTCSWPHSLRHGRWWRGSGCSACCW